MAKQGKKEDKKKPITKFGNSFWGSFLTSILVFLLLISAYSFISGGEKKEQISISELASAVKLSQVQSLKVKGGNVEAVFLDGVTKTTKKEEGASIRETLTAYGVTTEELSKIKVSINESGGALYWVFNLSPILFPVLFIAVFIWLMTRQIKGAGMQAFSFGQSRARITTPDDQKQKVTFKDVAGCKEAKEE